MPQLPDGDVVFLFAVLRTAPPASPEVERAIAGNRSLHEKAKSSGGKAYPIGAIPFTEADWMAHFGARWQVLCAVKHRYDSAPSLRPAMGYSASDTISPGDEFRYRHGSL